MNTNQNNTPKNFAQGFTRKLDKAVTQYLPDPFVIAILLTLMVIIMALVFTSSRPREIVELWYSSIWSLLKFTMQMALILITGYTLAQTPLFKSILRMGVTKLDTNTKSIIGITLISILCSWINWGLGLVAGALVAKQIVELHPQLNFKRLVASGYTGFIVWHGGLSGSIPLALNSSNNFSMEYLDGPLGLSQTLFSPLNLIALGGLIVILPLTNWFLSRSEVSSQNLSFKKDSSKSIQKENPADRLNQSRWLAVIFASLAILGLFLYSKNQGFQLNLDSINFMFLFLGFLLFLNPILFAKTFNEGTSKVGPILLQYPLYAGIMGLMKGTGLATLISKAFVSISGETFFPLMSFLSAGLVNIFVPSGGGQWVVQAPIMLPAALELGVSPATTALAVAWGDAWTNLLQPFWALPLLSIAGLETKDIMGHLLVVLLVSGLYLSSIFVIVPMLLS